MSAPIYMIDFEGSTLSGILEYGVVEIVGGEIGRCWTRLCRPHGRIPRRDRLTHGLSAEALATCEPVGVDWGFFSGLREAGVLAAHHATVEATLLKAVWPCPRLSRDFAAGSGEVSQGSAQWGPWIDSLTLYRRIYPDLSGYGLEVLVERFELSGELLQWAAKHCPADRRSYHCALFDALASALLLQALLKLPTYRDAALVDWIHWSARSAVYQAADPQLELGL